MFENKNHTIIDIVVGCEDCDNDNDDGVDETHIKTRFLVLLLVDRGINKGSDQCSALRVRSDLFPTGPTLLLFWGLPWEDFTEMVQSLYGPS